MKASLAAVATLFLVMGGAYGSVWFLDGRYAPLAAVEDLAFSQIKRDIRELKDRVEAAENPKLKRDLTLDLQDLLDRFCKSYPSDRDCAQR